MIKLASYTENYPHAGSAELLVNGLFDEPTGTIARTIPRHHINSAVQTAQTTSGTVGVNSIVLASGMLLSNIAWLSGSTPANGPTHQWLAICDAGLNVLGVTADQGSAAIAAATFYQYAFTQQVTITTTGLYYVALSTTSTTTAPTTAGIGTVTGVSTMVPIMAGTCGTQSTPPTIASKINSGSIGSITNNANFACWLS